MGSCIRDTRRRAGARSVGAAMGESMAGDPETEPSRVSRPRGSQAECNAGELQPTPAFRVGACSQWDPSSRSAMPCYPRNAGAAGAVPAVLVQVRKAGAAGADGAAPELRPERGPTPGRGDARDRLKAGALAGSSEATALVAFSADESCDERGAGRLAMRSVVVCPPLGEPVGRPGSRYVRRSVVV